MTGPTTQLAWPDVEAMLDGMLGRRYYTNHGPLARQLEAAVCERLGTAHAVLATNPAIGLVMLLEALDLSGDVLLSTLAPAWQARAVEWAGLGVRDCEADPHGPSLTADVVLRTVDTKCRPALCTPDDDIENVCPSLGLATCSIGWPGPGGAAVVALPGLAHGPKIACVLTDDDLLAGRLRNIRSSYGAGPSVAVRRTANGRVSEAQAGLVLAQLDALFSAEAP